MNTPKRALDIPGYYYDTISRRYYRQDPMNPKPQIFSRTPDENVLPETIIKSKRSVLNLLKRRESGFGKHSFENHVISSKSSNLNCVQTKYGVNRSQTSEDVEFLKAGDKTLYIEYSNKQRTSYFLEEKLHCFSPAEDTYECFFNSYPESFSTIDLVESPNGGNFLLLVVSNSNAWKVLLYPKNDPNIRQKVYTSPEPIWCCAKNEFTSRVAFGEQSHIVMSSLNGYPYRFKIPVKGQVRSIEFNKQGDSLFTGYHTGHIGKIDLRARECSVFNYKLHKIGIDETMLLTDENYLICGAFDGMICKVDLRMIKPVCEYFGHVKTPRKFYLSICEPNHLMCASGVDNVTRLWNISGGGEPIRCIKPPISGAPCRSWLISDGFKFLVYQFQKGHMYIYDKV